MPPNGRRWGSLGGGTILTAMEVRVGLIPADLKRRLPKEWGICIRCKSHLKPGQDCWINITRAATTFVERSSGSSTERGEEERRQGKGRGEKKGAKGKGKRGVDPWCFRAQVDAEGLRANAFNRSKVSD